MSPELLEVGRIERPHGVRGDVLVRLVTNREERIAPGAQFVAGGRTLRVVRSSAHQGRWIVTFDGINDREAADALRGVVLEAAPLEDPDELWVHDLVGSTVVDADGVERGTVVEVLANPASDLLVLESGALVPVRFIVRFTPGERIEIEAPAGLFDLG
jgi:16S rRNA processing protein RimM